MLNDFCITLDSLDEISRWVAVLDSALHIKHHNAPFARRFGTAKPGESLLARLNAPPTLRGALKTCAAKRLWTGVEVPIDRDGKPDPTWCEIYPGADGLVLLVMHSTRHMRQIELTYLDHLRSATDDSLWLLDQHGILIWAMVPRARAERVNAHLGQPVTLLVTEGDRPALHEALEKARHDPGEQHSVRLSPLDGLGGETPASPVNVDLVYLPEGTYGGRFYAASRSLAPRARGIISRIKEAYQVRTNSELGERLHVSGSAISRYGDAQTLPGEWLIRCHQDTRASLDWLYTGKGKKIFDL